jgi:HSP20 family molecular chaperone IbpA
MVIEPVINLSDDGKYLRVIANLPGTAEEKVSIDLEKTLVAISVTDTGSGKKYKKCIAFPFEVRLEKKKFQNGILDLTLEKRSFG